MFKSYAFLFVSFTVFVLYCDSAPAVYTITFQQYTSIKIGWTQDQIKKLVGTSGKVISQTGTGTSAFITIQYTGSKSSAAIATFLFQGKKLLSKAQIGLDTGTYRITYKQYTAIKIGWTPTQVKNTVGNSGSTVSEAGTGTTAATIVHYTIVGITYGLVQLGFVGGKLASKFEVGFSAAVKNKITFQQYTSIKIGWTQAQVTKLLGGSGTIVYEIGFKGSPFQMTTVQYTGSKSSLTSAVFMFQNGVLSSKAQTGLDAGVYTITEKQYKQIQIGWTRDQLTNLVGSTGSAISEAGTGRTAVVTVKYTPVGSTYGFVQLIFSNGRLNSKTAFGFKR